MPQFNSMIEEATQRLAQDLAAANSAYQASLQEAYFQYQQAMVSASNSMFSPIRDKGDPTASTLIKEQDNESKSG